MERGGNSRQAMRYKTTVRVEVDPTDDGTYRMAGGLQPVSMPMPATRTTIRRLVDQATLDVIEQAASVVTRAPLGTVVMNDAVTAEDLKAEWISKPVVRLVQAVGILSSDPLNNKSIGRGKVTRRLERVAARAVEVADLYDFLSFFRSEVLSEVWLPVLRASVEAAAHLQAALTADTEAASEEACRQYEGLRKEFEAELYVILAAVAHTSDALELRMGGPKNYLRELFGIKARKLIRARGAWIDRIRRSGHDPRELVEARFAFLDSLDFSDDDYLRSYVNLAFRLAASWFPLLANRALQLTMRLLTEADTADQQSARDLVTSFFLSESSWIVASRPAYESAMNDYLRKDDRPAIVEALRRLSEGVLRPYGSLVASVAAISEGSAAVIPLAVAPTLGDLEQRLNPERSSIEALILPLIRREWRNADAHARAAVGPTGELNLRLDDGSIKQVVANEVFGHVTMLRSALDGVDAAFNIFHVTKAAPPSAPAIWPSLSKEMVHLLAQEAANRTVLLMVEDVTASGDKLEIRLAGRAARKKLRWMLDLLGRMTMGQYAEIAAVSRRGRTLAKVIRVSPGPALPDQVIYWPV
jgi:hypothetical protein